MSTRQTPKLIDNHGREIHLGEELGKGGEGRVHAINGDKTKAAKIYLKPTTQSHDAKLNAMVSMANDELFSWGAWPSHTLHEVSGKPVGFLMPRINNHRTLYDLFNPKMRAQHFPNVDWRFMFATATNMARAFAFVHRNDLVIGDVNDGNLLVAQDATCKFLDFDSYQINHWGHQWLCGLGTREYQPPEIMSNATPRTPNYDNFGLAVLIFHLLFAGRHPFFGVYQSDDDAPDVVAAIKSFRYAYSQEPWRTEMLPPPNSLPIEALPATIRNMFELAFSPAGVIARPTASDWVEALRGIAPSLRQCTHNPAHYYHWDHCHWCDIEANSGVSLFASKAPPPPPVAVSQLVSSETWPPAPPPQPKPRVSPRQAKAAGTAWAKAPWQPPPGAPMQAPMPAAPTTPPPVATPMPPFVPPIQQAAQSLSWQAGWLVGKAWGWTKAKAKVHPAITTFGVLLGGVWLLGALISAIAPVPHQTHPMPATDAEKRVIMGAPFVPPASPPVRVAETPPPVTPPPPASIYTQAPSVVPAQPASPPTPAPAQPVFHDRVGPSFDCVSARAPVLKFICDNEDLDRSNLEMMQPFYVLLYQNGTAGFNALQKEISAFYDHTFGDCLVDVKTGALPPARALDICLNLAFKRERALWLSRLQGDGLEEASRDIEQHVDLQQTLKRLGYAPPTDRNDGNYGPSTRAAIIRWQTASSLPPTGLLGDSQVNALLQSPPAAIPAVEPPAFMDGLQDRRTWETWFGGLSGAARDGADWWAGQRSQPHPGSCETQVDRDARWGCLVAADKLAPFDARRKKEPDYKRGWSSY